MATTHPKQALHRMRTASTGPRTRELLHRGHHTPVTPPRLPAGRLCTAIPDPLRMADLFAGIGGFHLAFGKIGVRTVFACENNPTARRIYETNFRTSSPELFDSDNFAGDISVLEPAHVPDHDVLTAGFPCQPFSTAGKRRGFTDTRGLHFFEIARILDAKRPAAFFLENVKGLLRHEGGRTFDIIRTVLTEDLGYSLHAQVIRACDFGVPQLRPRLFMVGFCNPATPFTFPEPVQLTTTLSDVLGGQCERAVSRTLLASGYHKLYGKKFNWAHYLVDGHVHRLTAREALALQGFPDDFQIPDSYSTAMRLIGNSIAVPAAEATARQIGRSLGAKAIASNTDSDTHAVMCQPLRHTRATRSLTRPRGRGDSGRRPELDRGSRP
ncbi:DNA cytosine methyltransferase [Mycobacteroides abscessus]|uniref:DNA cytosine methyltransferase n=1 Tax=Mycobacteroides abscessus TaxID=36809 RepID=UPI0009C593DF|nr:DNA cytosine methyltransferase [Mycobacteroides abscessus]MDM2096390.1 DNA cytosine methyltransferase [Mycobacteroides abscessus]MDM2121121.1 DNA cytosine methyltransferase [Mycobacteroides abscessus]MDM2203042.1 DNA cytosine methyltransferase [Mycobacteroides abscessus]SLC30950.1 DNA-cytosine methyltransferase [Mycobacteroides abscessus subsp. massiliense]SLC56481.1 DNA-cytosine methyltransferase [Mycobacteroides abscessus subsp. massiliense]